jgi:hypothetical protein
MEKDVLALPSRRQRGEQKEKAEEQDAARQQRIRQGEDHAAVLSSRIRCITPASILFDNLRRSV